MSKFVASQSELPRGLGRERTSEDTALPDRRFPKIVTVAWLTLGIASVALASIAAQVLHSERESTVILHQLNVISLNLEDVLADLADAEAEAREYVLTGRGSSLENFEQSNKALALEFDRLTTLVKNNPAERQEVERVRSLVQQDLDELQKSLAGRTAGRSRAAPGEILTGRARKLAEALRQSITGIGEAQQGTLARLAQQRRVRLTTALASVSGALMLAAFYLLIGQIIIARSASRRQRTEEALRASEKRFEALCEQAPVGIYSTDAQGLCVYTNPQWSQMSGLSAAESLGHGWKKALHPDDRETVFESWRTNALQGASWEYRVLTPQGEIRWIRALGGAVYSTGNEITGYVGTTEDITERKLADRALQERNALNRAILNSLPANIAVMKSDGTIEAANESWLHAAQIKGEAPACWVETGANYLKACSDAASAGLEDARKALAGIQDVLAGRLRSFEMEYSSEVPYGKRWFYMLAYPLSGVSAGGAVITHVDNTDRKRGRQWFRLAVEAAPSGMVVSDSDGKIVLVNSLAENQFGYRREELIGQPVEMLVPEPLRERHLTLRQDFYQHPRVRLLGKEQDLYARRKNGTQFPVEIGLNPITTDEGSYVLSSIADITERRRAEDERQKFVSLAEQSLEYIGMYDLDLKPFYVNRAGLRLVGVDSLEAARGVEFQEHFFPDDQPFIVNEFLPRLQRDGYGKVEIRFRHFKTGEPIWVLYNMFGIYDARGSHVGWGTVSADVTERKRAEEALRESRQELRALAGRLINAEAQERQRIARELHDDLSQKLAVLVFDAGGLLVGPPLTPDNVRERLFQLRTRIVELAQDVRQISHQLHPSILQDLGLTAALRELCEEFSAREGIEVLFTREGTPETLPVEVASCLYRVAQEALHNVLKHARTGYVQVKVHSNANGIHMTIRDTGVGFDAEGASRRPGLGIVSMKERVRLVQGEFSIHSQPGQGTEVRVFVPLPKEASRAA